MKKSTKPTNKPKLYQKEFKHVKIEARAALSKYTINIDCAVFSFTVKLLFALRSTNALLGL